MNIIKNTRIIFNLVLTGFVMITSCSKETIEPERITDSIEELPNEFPDCDHYIGELYGGGIVFYVDG